MTNAESYLKTAVAAHVAGKLNEKEEAFIGEINEYTKKELRGLPSPQFKKLRAIAEKHGRPADAVPSFQMQENRHILMTYTVICYPSQTAEWYSRNVLWLDKFALVGVTGWLVIAYRMDLVLESEGTDGSVYTPTEKGRLLIAGLFL